MEPETVRALREAIDQLFAVEAEFPYHVRRQEMDRIMHARALLESLLAKGR